MDRLPPAGSTDLRDSRNALLELLRSKIRTA